MKNQLPRFFAFSLIFVTSLCAAVDTGKSAPAFTLSDTTGSEHRLSDFTGKYVVLEWTNHKCPFVVKYYKNGDMQALQQTMTADGVIWLQVLSSSPGKQGYLSASEGEALRESHEMRSSAMLLDASGEVARAYGARVTPHMYLINPEGVIVYQGAIDSIKSTRPSDIAQAENYLKAAYGSSKAGKPIENATTVPYGCGIKY